MCRLVIFSAVSSKYPRRTVLGLLLTADNVAFAVYLVIVIALVAINLVLIRTKHRLKKRERKPRSAFGY